MVLRSLSPARRQGAFLVLSACLGSCAGVGDAPRNVGDAPRGVVMFAAVDGRVGAAGTAADPLPFGAALAAISRRLREPGARRGSGRVELVVRGGRYPIEAPFTLGPEFRGSAGNPIVIRAAPGKRSCSTAASRFRSATWRR